MSQLYRTVCTPNQVTVSEEDAYPPPPDKTFPTVPLPPGRMALLRRVTPVNDAISAERRRRADHTHYTVLREGVGAGEAIKDTKCGVPLFFVPMAIFFSLLTLFVRLV